MRNTVDISWQTTVTFSKHFCVAGVPLSLAIGEPGSSLWHGVAQTFLYLLGPFLVCDFDMLLSSTLKNLTQSFRPLNFEFYSLIDVSLLQVKPRCSDLKNGKQSSLKGRWNVEPVTLMSSSIFMLWINISFCAFLTFLNKVWPSQAPPTVKCEPCPHGRACFQRIKSSLGPQTFLRLGGWGYFGGG